MNIYTYIRTFGHTCFRRDPFSQDPHNKLLIWYNILFLIYIYIVQVEYIASRLFSTIVHTKQLFYYMQSYASAVVIMYHFIERILYITIYITESKTLSKISKIVLTYTHSHRLTYTPTYSHTLTHTPTYSHTLLHTPTYSHTLPHTHIIPTYSHTLTHTPTYFHTLPQTHTHSYILPHPPTYSHTLLHTHTHSHILTHTPTYSHTLPHTPTYSYTLLHTPTDSNTQHTHTLCGIWPMMFIINIIIIFITHDIPYIVLCRSMYIVQCTMYIDLNSVQCTMYIVHYLLISTQCILFSV